MTHVYVWTLPVDPRYSGSALRSVTLDRFLTGELSLGCGVGGDPSLANRNPRTAAEVHLPVELNHPARVAQHSVDYVPRSLSRCLVSLQCRVRHACGSESLVETRLATLCGPLARTGQRHVRVSEQMVFCYPRVVAARPYSSI